MNGRRSDPVLYARLIERQSDVLVVGVIALMSIIFTAASFEAVTDRGWSWRLWDWPPAFVVSATVSIVLVRGLSLIAAWAAIKLEERSRRRRP